MPNSIIDFAEVLHLLEEMFPGDATASWPSFSSLGENAIEGVRGEFSAIAKLLTVDKEGLSQLNDINAKLRRLRRISARVVDSFVSTALSVYFTSPSVVSTVRRRPATPFPHIVEIPEDDYTLLVPVLNLCYGYLSK